MALINFVILIRAVLHEFKNNLRKCIFNVGAANLTGARIDGFPGGCLSGAVVRFPNPFNFTRRAG